jgi:hypothetical protein
MECFMAVTVATVEAAITAIEDGGQSVTIDGQTYTQGNLRALIELRDRLNNEAGRSDGTRPTMRGVNFGTMGY